MSNNTTLMPQETVNRIAQDVRRLVDDAGQLLDGAAKRGNAEFDAIHARVTGCLQEAGRHLDRIEAVAVDRTKRAVHTTNQAAHEHPYAVLGIGAAVGLLVGWIVTRR
jgi:ElaB/YqjD/DUF883 family membrane-anchored ribosome-binding protein